MCDIRLFRRAYLDYRAAENLREELKEPGKKERLAAFFPKNYQPESDFEWNCLYQIYRRQLEA